MWTGNPHAEFSFPVHIFRHLRHWDLPKVVPPTPGVSPSQNQPGLLRQWLIRLKNSFPFSLFFGLGGPWYVWQAWRAFHQLPENEKPDLVFTSFYPLSDLLAGYWIKRTHPRITWVADFRDIPVDKTKNQVLWPSLTDWFISRLLRKADQVTAVSSGVANQLPVQAEKIYILYNGYSIDQLADLSDPVSEKFTITYIGSVQLGLKRIDVLLERIQALINHRQIDAHDINLQYAGPQSDIWQTCMRYYPDIPLVYLGYLGDRAAINLQQSSQINLLLSWATRQSSGILTSKLYQYLAAKRPILALVEGHDDAELAHFVGVVNGGLCSYSTDPGRSDLLDQWLLDQYRQWKALGKVPHHTNADELQKYSWNQLVNTWLNP